MHCLTARALGCADQTKIAEDWFVQDISLLREKRTHHLVDRLAQGRELLYDREFLLLLADKRRRCKEQIQEDSFWDEGPYPIQVFPYEFAEPEQELLHPGTRPEFDRSVPLDSEVEAIMVELLSGEWA